MIKGKGYLYIHIPKTGGTSITSSLMTQHNSSWVGAADAHAVPDFPTDFRDLIRFAFVREPFDFYRSWYAYRRTTPGTGWSFDRHMEKSFSDFVRDCAEESLLTEFYKRFTPYVDVYGRYERLEEDLNEILVAAEAEPVTLPRLNTSDPEHADMDLLTDDIIELVEKNEADVFTLWNNTENGLYEP